MTSNVVHCKKAKYHIYIGRPSPWGNPYVIGEHGARNKVIELYEEWLWQPKRFKLRNKIRNQLRGKILGCWCAPQSCHGTILVACSLTPMEVEADDARHLGPVLSSES